MNTCIELQNISKEFTGKKILDRVFLRIEKGEAIGIVGGNGSGKSVLFQIICGFLKPDHGVITINGVPLGEKTDFPKQVGVFINAPGFIGNCTGYENLKFLADIQGIIGKEEIIDAMEKVGLDPSNKTKVDHYSLGMKQKLGIAQAFMENQEILILDEPFNALDYKTYQDVKEIIRMLSAEGKTILMTSHHYEDIQQLCERVYHIEDGVVRVIA